VGTSVELHAAMVCPQTCAIIIVTDINALPPPRIRHRIKRSVETVAVEVIEQPVAVMEVEETLVREVSPDDPQ
jgi:hypothetical protein